VVLAPWIVATRPYLIFKTHLHPNTRAGDILRFFIDRIGGQASMTAVFTYTLSAAQLQALISIGYGHIGHEYFNPVSPGDYELTATQTNIAGITSVISLPTSFRIA